MLNLASVCRCGAPDKTAPTLRRQATQKHFAYLQKFTLRNNKGCGPLRSVGVADTAGGHPLSAPLRTLVLSIAAVLAQGCATAPAHSERTAIIGATVFDGAGAAPFEATVIIEDGLIAEIVSPERTVTAETTIDASGLALLPGLLDLHTHFTPGGEPPYAPQILHEFAKAGVTTVNDFHQPPVSFNARRDWYAGLAGPDVKFAARMSTRGGHGADWADTNQTAWVDTPYAARAAVEDLVPLAPDLIKVFADGWRYGSGIDNTSMNLPTLTELVLTAHENDLKVVTHTVTVDRAKIAARADVDVIVHSILDRLADAELIELMLASGTAFAPTLAVYEADKPWGPPLDDSEASRDRRARFEIALKNVKALHDAGVPIALGTDSGMRFTPHGLSSIRELELLERAGLTPSEALIAGTANSASVMGYPDRGVIKPGMRADIILVDGEPWSDLSAMHSVRRTIVAGKTVFGPGAPEPSTERLPPAVTPDGVIADFESGVARTNADEILMLTFDSGVQRSSGVMKVIDDGDGNHVLEFMGKLTQREDPEAGVVLPFARGWITPVDVREQTGIRLRIRGEEGEYPVRLQTPDGFWTGSVSASPRWSTVPISFEEFAGPEGAMWSGADIVSIHLLAPGSGGDVVWFEIDDVEFY